MFKVYDSYTSYATFGAGPLNTRSTKSPNEILRESSPILPNGSPYYKPKQQTNNGVKGRNDTDRCLLKTAGLLAPVSSQILDKERTAYKEYVQNGPPVRPLRVRQTGDEGYCHI